MITLEIKGLEKLMQMADKYPTVSIKHINKAITKSLSEIEREAKQNAPRGDTGYLSLGWKTDKKPLEGTLRSTANNNGYNYGLVVEYGRKPGKGFPYKEVIGFDPNDFEDVEPIAVVSDIPVYETEEAPKSMTTDTFKPKKAKK